MVLFTFRKCGFSLLTTQKDVFQVDCRKNGSFGYYMLGLASLTNASLTHMAATWTDFDFLQSDLEHSFCVDGLKAASEDSLQNFEHVQAAGLHLGQKLLTELVHVLWSTVRMRNEPSYAHGELSVPAPRWSRLVPALVTKAYVEWVRKFKPEAAC